MSIDIFVPGRVCLFGEHSDWAGNYRNVNSSISIGHALVCGTSQGVYARAKRHPTQLKLRSILNDGSHKEFAVLMDEKSLRKCASEGGFWSYACGVALEILVHFNVGGVEINNYKTDLPVKKGLSSSAAFCVMVTRAFNQLYDLKMNVRGEMDFAYRGEINTPSRCGRMDQGCAFGNTVVSMNFDANVLLTREVSVKSELFLIIVDLKGTKDTKKILSDLHRSYPFPQNNIHEGVHQLLGPVNTQILNEAMNILETPQNADEKQSVGSKIGELMTTAQNYFDKFAIPACPEELTAPILHKVLKYDPIQHLVYGGKGVGSQGDGTAQLVAKSKEAQTQVIDILERELNLSCLPVNLSPNTKKQANHRSSL